MSTDTGLVGRKVRIPRGTVVRSVRKGRANPYPLSRAQTVLVDHVLPSYHLDEDTGRYTEGPPVICWAGSGGYWCECSSVDVKVVEND